MVKFLTVLFFLALVSLHGAPSVLASPSVYWGAYIAGNTYGVGNPPWDWQAVDAYQANTKKNISVLHWGQRWYWSNQAGYPGIGDGKFQKFETATFEKVRLKGVIPMIGWNSWAAGTDPVTGQTYGQPSPNFKLADVYNGKYDIYIRQWATDAKAWGYPFFLRFDHEMNGTWYSYSERANGNATGDFVKAWKHVHDIFTSLGATNVTWVWCPNTDYSGSIPLEGLYPGDNYVDWTCIDGYNWSSDKPDTWKGFYSIMKPTYDHLLAIAPSKPIMIGETGSSKDGGSKSAWISDTLTTQIPINFPKIKALVWFNWDDNQTIIDWPIEGNHFDLQAGTPIDQTSINAFANAISSDYYASNSYINLPKLTKITPLASGQAPATLAFGFSADGITSSGKTEKVDMFLRNASLPPVDILAVPVTSDANGVFRPTTPVNLGAIAPGTYEIFIKDDSHLKKRLGSMSIITGSNTAPSTFDSKVFLAGDFNADNVLSALDLAAILAKYTALSVAVTSANQKYDVNLDSKIELGDIGIVLSNYNSLQILGE